jgi:hypothetical protein
MLVARLVFTCINKPLTPIVAKHLCDLRDQARVIIERAVKNIRENYTRYRRKDTEDLVSSVRLKQGLEHL